MNIGRVVLDTNIFVSALLSREGKPAKIYRMFLARVFALVYSDAILGEYCDVLYRPRLRIAQDDADIVLSAVRGHGEKVRVTPSTAPIADEDDRIFYDAAKCSGAFLVTGNTRHYPNEPNILTATSFLELCNDKGASVHIREL